uniref:Luciferin 4-monooxygenase n=2 Tax=Lygus hesperus TaxID=30085 RepID=A0A0A9Y1R7_LYGHE
MFATRTLFKDCWRGARRPDAGRRLSSSRQHLQARVLARILRRPPSSTFTRAASTQDGSNIIRGLFPDEPVPAVTFHEYLWSRSHKWADATAVTCGVSGRKVTYKDLKSRCTAFGGALRRDLGLKTDDRMAVLLPNCAEFIVASLGAMEAGVIPSPMNPMYTPDEVAHQLKDSGASAAVTLVQFLPTIMKAAKLAGMERLKIVVLQKGEDPLPASVFTMTDLLAAGDPSAVNDVKRTPDDIAMLPYSSGTTGRAKGVMLTNRNITANLQALDKKKDHIERTENWTEVIPLILPLFHIYGFAIAGLTLYTGGEIISLPKFEEETFLKSLEKATILYVAPPLVIYLGASPRVTSATVKTLKSVVSGAAPCASSDILRVAKKMPQALYKQGYGLTETSPLVCSTPNDVENHSSVGPPALNTYVKVVDVESGKALGPDQPGEIVVKGPQVMKGYWKNQKATDEVLKDGWFYTGDIGYYDSDGYFYITDRLKELIKVKGFQVAPAELEGILRSHPDVMDAGVIGAPDPINGEKPVAFVALKPGTRKDPEFLKTFLQEKVAKFKRVNDFIFVDSIPKSAAGKILRKELRRIVNERQS